jgi:hypothetical protein
MIALLTELRLINLAVIYKYLAPNGAKQRLTGRHASANLHLSVRTKFRSTDCAKLSRRLRSSNALAASGKCFGDEN